LTWPFDIQSNNSLDDKSEFLEWIITRVEAPQQGEGLPSPYHVPTELFPFDSECQTQSHTELRVGTMHNEDTEKSNRGLLPARHFLQSMPKLNFVGIVTDAGTPPDIVTARSGFLTAREPSPVIVLGTNETSPTGNNDTVL
jgi:hypothetical protein